jgi:hypothetical protein
MKIDGGKEVLNMAEKQCPSCKMMIDKDAKVCPHCRRKFGPTKPVKYFLIFILFICIISVVSEYNKNNTPVNITKSKVINEDTIKLSKIGESIKKKHPSWENDICNTIAEKKVQIGMTSNQVISSWGKPEKNNRTVGSWGTHEQWVYGNTYLYFENGIFTSFQDEK